MESFLLYRKFYEERRKVLESFDKPQHIYRIKGAELDDGLLIKYKN